MSRAVIERKLVALLLYAPDEQRAEMLRQIYADRFAMPFFRWMVERLQEIHAAGRVTWESMITDLVAGESHDDFPHTAGAIGRIFDKTIVYDESEPLRPVCNIEPEVGEWVGLYLQLLELASQDDEIS